MHEYDHYTRSAATERRGRIDRTGKGDDEGSVGGGEGVEGEFDRSS